MEHLLSDHEMLRYNRQIVIPGFDFMGQERLKTARVLIIGLGGLGCAAASWLAAAGIGQLTLVDFDVVTLSNLQRQTLHNDAQIGQPKVFSAARQLAIINPHCQLHPVHQQLEDEPLQVLISQHQVVLDCTDNITSREQINRLCYQQQVPLVSGAAIRMEGQLCVFTWQPDTPCYRCISRLFTDRPLSCVERGVMAPLPGTIGAMQATETIKLLTLLGPPPVARLLIYDAFNTTFKTICIKVDKHCEVCQTT